MNDRKKTFNQKNMQLIDTLAQDFFEAFYSGQYLGDTSLPIAELSLDEAYLVQDKVTEKKIEICLARRRYLKFSRIQCLLTKPRPQILCVAVAPCGS